jgi:D-3-phosphoglycerate dehydrogenase
MSKELKVLVLDPLPETALAVFRNSNYKVDFADGELSEAALCRKVEDYNIICVKDKRPETYLTDEVIKSAHRLLAIGVFSQYTSSVDLSTAQNLGIPVFSSPYGHSQAVAELCISFIILLARQVGDRSMEVHSGEWNKVSANCYEIRGKTLGVLGYGHVGVALGILAEVGRSHSLFH